jgi:hypothetical protein
MLYNEISFNNILIRGIMRLDRFAEIFTDQEMRTKLCGPKPGTEAVYSEIVKNIFAQKDTKEFLTSVLLRIQEAIYNPALTGNCKQIIKKIEEAPEYPKFAESLPKIILPALKVRDHGEFGTFPEESFPLSEMMKRAEALRNQNFAKGYDLIEKLKSDEATDPAMTAAKIARSKDKRLPGQFWDDVDTPFGCFQLGSCPATIEETSLLLKNVIDNNIRALVCLHQSGEHAAHRISDFWEPKRLTSLQIPGWKIEKIKEEELENRRPPRLVESTLEAWNEKEDKKILFPVLHLDGWPDQSPMPCGEELFDALQKRIAVLCPNATDRIWINCIGGIGRTGTTAAGRCLLQMITQEQQRGNQLAEKPFNILELIYALRKQRSEQKNLRAVKE